MPAPWEASPVVSAGVQVQPGPPIPLAPKARVLPSEHPSWAPAPSAWPTDSARVLPQHESSWMMPWPHWPTASPSLQLPPTGPPPGTAAHAIVQPRAPAAGSTPCSSLRPVLGQSPHQSPARAQPLLLRRWDPAPLLHSALACAVGRCSASEQPVDGAYAAAPAGSGYRGGGLAVRTSCSTLGRRPVHLAWSTAASWAVCQSPGCDAGM